jgi:hypothetical protein
MADQKFDSSDLAQWAAEDKARRERNRQRSQSKFETREGVEVTLQDPEVKGWEVTYPKQAGDELMNKGAEGALVQGHTKRTDQITRRKPGDPTDPF